MTLPYAKPDFSVEDYLAPTSYTTSNGDVYANLYSGRHLYGVPKGVIIGATSTNTDDPDNPLTTVSHPPVSVGAITDGSSNTILGGEQDYGLKNDFFSSTNKRAGQLRGGQGVWAHGYPRGLNFSTWGKFNLHTVNDDVTSEENGISLVPQPALRRRNFVLADGSVRFFKDSISKPIYPRALHPCRRRGDLGRQLLIIDETTAPAGRPFASRGRDRAVALLKQERHDEHGSILHGSRRRRRLGGRDRLRGLWASARPLDRLQEAHARRIREAPPRRARDARSSGEHGRRLERPEPAREFDEPETAETPMSWRASWLAASSP